MRVVVDTNVFVSIAIGGRALAPIRDAWEAGRITLLISEPLLSELEEVLSREKLARYFRGGRQRAYLEAIEKVGEWVYPEEPYPEFADVKCAYLLAMLRLGGDVLVTGDKALLDLEHFEDTVILSPRDFTESLS